MAENSYPNWETYTNARFKPLPFKDQSADMGFFVRPLIGLAAREETAPIVPAGGTQEQARLMPPLSLPKEADLQVDNPNVNPNFQPAQQTQQVQQAQTVAPQQLTPPAPAQPIADNNYTQAEIQNMKLYGMPQPPAVVTTPTVGMPVQQYTPNAVTYQIPDTTQDAYKQVMDNYYVQKNDAIPQQRAYWQKAHNFANSELDRQALIRQREEEQFQEAKARSERAYAKEKEGDGSSWWNPVGILTGLGEVFYGSRKYNPQTRQYELTAPTSWKEATQNIVRNIATAGSGLSFGYGKGGLRTAYNAAMPEFYRAKREQNQRAPHVAWEAAQDRLLAQSIDPNPRQPLRPWTFDTPLPTVDHPFTNFMVDKAQKEAAFRSVADQLEREREMFGYTPEQYNERARELFGRQRDIQEVIDAYEKYADANNVPEKERRKVRRELEYAKLGLNAPAEEKNIQEVIDERREELAATMKLLADANIPEADRGVLALQIVLGGGINGSTGRGKGSIDLSKLGADTSLTKEEALELAPNLIASANAVIGTDDTPGTGNVEEAKGVLEQIASFRKGIKNLNLGVKDYDREALSSVEAKLNALIKAEKTSKEAAEASSPLSGVHEADTRTEDERAEASRRRADVLRQQKNEEEQFYGLWKYKPPLITETDAPWYRNMKNNLRSAALIPSAFTAGPSRIIRGLRNTVTDDGETFMDAYALPLGRGSERIGDYRKQVGNEILARLALGNTVGPVVSKIATPPKVYEEDIDALRSFAKRSLSKTPTVRGEVIKFYKDKLIDAAKKESVQGKKPTRITFIKSAKKWLNDNLKGNERDIVLRDDGMLGTYLGVPSTNAELINEYILDEMYNQYINASK